MLEEIFLNQTLGPLGFTNFLKHAIHWAVAQGFSLELLVLLLLLPLAATLVAFARCFVGVGGLGIFAPLMMGVIFLATGIIPGILLFLFILLVEILVINLLKKLKIHFIAEMALILLIVCLGFFLLLALVAQFNLQSLLNFSLIPVLILILLGENLAEIQVRKSPQKAARAITETLILATLAFFILNSIFLKKVALLYPEAIVFLVAIADLLIGRFTGLRLLEYRRFRKLLKG